MGRYYDLMVRLSLHQDDYLATTKHYLAVYHTLVAQEEQTLQARAILQNVLIFVILSPYGNEQSDLLARVVREDPVKNAQMGWVGKFVQSFTGGEILRYTPLRRG
jgi:26S proteasome regulatory subunit N5